MLRSLRRKAAKADLGKAPSNQPAPRKLEEIQADYAKAVSDSGQVQYQVFVYGEELKQLNHKLLQLNQEAARRAQLDKEEKAEKGEQNVAQRT